MLISGARSCVGALDGVHVNVLHAQQNTFRANVDGVVAGFVRRSLDWAAITLTAAWKHAAVSDDELNKAREALREAKGALLEAETRFDIDCDTSPARLIGMVK